MRSGFLFFSLFLFPLLSRAQVYAELPNNEFDNWEADGFSPAAWVTVESIFKKESGMVEKEVADKVNGNASVTLVTKDIGMGAQYSILSCGSGYYSTSPHGIALKGIPYTDRPSAMWVLYKSIPVEKDTVGLLINMYQNKSGTQVGVLQRALYLSPSADWKLIKIDLDSRYIKKEAPDSILFSFYSSITKTVNRKVGTKFQLDGIYFNEPSPLSIQAANTAAKGFTVYPNPCTGKILHLRSALKVGGYNFELHGFDGAQRKKIRLQDDFINELNTGDLAPGAYLWVISDEQGTIISKGKCVLM